MTPEETPVRKHNSSRDEVNKDKEKSVRDKDNQTTGQDEVDGPHRQAKRVSSSPPPYDPPTHVNENSRPVSTGSFEGAGGSLTGSGSEMSIGENLQMRKVKGRMASSPKIGDRPKVRIVCF